MIILLVQHAYRAHTRFAASGATFEVTSIGAFGNNIEFLVVAGGGGGGQDQETTMQDKVAVVLVVLITNVPGVATPGPSPNPNVPLTRSSVFDVANAGGTYPVTVGAGGMGGFYPGAAAQENGVGGNVEQIQF